MAASVPVEQLAFGPFCLDRATARIFRNGVEVELRFQAFRALTVLLQNSGRPVDYEQMIREAWDGVYVSRHTVAVTVGEVKKTLGEYGAWINCRPGLGYFLEVPKGDDLIRKGGHFMSHRTREGLERAVGCFQQAAGEDPADFRAFEGLSRSYLTLGTCGMRPPREMYAAFLEAHQQAVALAGLTPELRSDRGYGLHMFERREAEAEAELLHAQQEQPGLATIYLRLTMVYAALGRLDEALSVLDQAYSADALLPVLPATEICIRCLRREYERAVDAGKRALELHPYVQLGRAFYAQALESLGRVDEALVQYRNACVICPGLPWLRALEAACLAKSGQRLEATGILGELDEVRATDYVDAYYMALLREALGDREGALGEVARAFAENSTALPILKVDPRMDTLRTDPCLSGLWKLPAIA